MAARVLKIGMHLRFCPKFTVEFEYFDQKKFRQAYSAPGEEVSCREIFGFMSRLEYIKSQGGRKQSNFRGPDR